MKWAIDSPRARRASMTGRRARRTSARSGRMRPGSNSAFEFGQHKRVVISGAAEHHAVEVIDHAVYGGARRQTAIQHDRQLREFSAQTAHATVIQRRNLAVFLRAEPLQPCFARMHDEHVTTRTMHAIDETMQASIVVLVVDTDATFHRHRNLDCGTHRRDAFANERWFAHQAGAKSTGLHALAWAAAVEVDFVVTEVLADARRLRQQCRLRTTELQCQWVLGNVESEQACTITLNSGVGVHHFGIQPGMRR